jgi:hypothetical protein
VKAADRLRSNLALYVRSITSKPMTARTTFWPKCLISLILFLAGGFRPFSVLMSIVEENSTGHLNGDN